METNKQQDKIKVDKIKVSRLNCIKAVTEKVNREIIQEIISQIKKSGVVLSEKQSIELFKLLITTNCSQRIVTMIFESIENIIKDYLYEANYCATVVINIFKGISINAQHIPERIKVNPFKGVKEKYKAYVKPKAKFSKEFIESITNH